MNISDSNHCLFKALKGYILHCTSTANYKLICADGYIRPNRGDFSISWEQTVESRVHKIGGISLLDFGLPEDETFFVTDQENYLYAWQSILIGHKPSVIIKISRDRIYDQIITNEQIKEKIQEGLLIPFNEVCSLDPIPTSVFEGIVIVKPDLDFVENSSDFLSEEFLESL